MEFTNADSDDVFFHQFYARVANTTAYVPQFQALPYAFVQRSSWTQQRDSLRSHAEKRVRAQHQSRSRCVNALRRPWPLSWQATRKRSRLASISKFARTATRCGPSERARDCACVTFPCVPVPQGRVQDAREAHHRPRRQPHPQVRRWALLVQRPVAMGGTRANIGAARNGGQAASGQRRTDCEHRTWHHGPARGRRVVRLGKRPRYWLALISLKRA